MPLRKSVRIILFHESLEKEYGSKTVTKAEDTTDIVTVPAKKEIVEPKPPVNTITATIPETEVVGQPKPQIPPRPVMPLEAAAFPRLQKVKVTLDKHNNLIFEAERERTKLRKSEPSKPDYPASSDNMDLQRYRISTQHSIPHSVPQTYIKINVPSGKKPTEKNPLQKPKPCTKSYSGIKKRLTDTIPANLIEAEIKGRDDRPQPKK